MSMIEDQISEMRHYIKRYQEPPYGREIDGTVEVLERAIYTIQDLSEKLAAANMERSTRYYNGGWIPTDEALPEFTVTSGSGDEDLSPKVLASIVYGDGSTDVTMSRCHRDGTWSAEFFSVPKCKVAAWAPLPEPYRGGKEDGDD